MHHYFHAMKRPFTYAGRATRAEFWLFTLISGLIGIAGQLIDIWGGTQHRFFILISLVQLFPSIAVSVRRLHDTDRSGWLYWLVFTIIGVIPLLVFFCQRGSLSANSYGPADPTTYASASQAVLPSAAFGGSGAGQVANSIQEIERLAELKARGVLSDGEFESLKGKVLGGSDIGRVEPRF